jgi:crotonobetainyl-CoA:carnitine CoA-transferase CaiB-like acyl-CoA transferase
MTDPIGTGTLSGITVLEVGEGVARAVAGMILADSGAQVSRSGTSEDGDPGYAMWHRNKQLLDSDSDSPLDRLLDSIDVCIVGPGCPEIEAKLATLAARHPRTVFLIMPPYCGEAPWHGQAESSELIAAVMGLAMRQSSNEDGPVDSVYPHVAYVHGMWAATCAIAALVEREVTGLGQVVTVSAAHAALVTGTATFVIDPEAVEPAKPIGAGGPNPLYTRYKCQDGRWLFLGALTAKFQQRALEVLGLEEIEADERLGGALDRTLLPENRDWVRERIATRFLSRTRQDWLDRLEAVDCPAGPVMDREYWLDHPQIRAIGMRVEVQDPQRGTVIMPGIPLTLAESPGRILAADEPTRAVSSASPPSSGNPPRGPVAGRGPLAGFRVLNLGTVLAGPLSGCLLSELGADVTKVEPLSGDPFRTRGFVYNRGMRSIAIDLRSRKGKEAFDHLVRETDVVLDNFRPGVLQRLGIDYESLSEVNPDVVCFSMTGFGDRGPLADRPGFDPILQAMSGMMTAQGGTDDPVFLTVAVNDIAGAVMGALAACLGLLHRVRHGEGQPIRSSLAAMSVFMQSGELVRFEGRSPARAGGNDYRGPAPLDRYYRTSDGWVRVHHRTVNCPDGAAGPDVILSEEICRDLTTRGLLESLSKRGVPAAAARRPAELIADPDLMAAGAFHEHRRADGRPFFTPGRVARFSRTQETRKLTAPGLGEHTRDVLVRAGLSDAEVETLLAEGVVASGGPFVVRELVAYR